MPPYVEYDEAGAACSDCGRQFPTDEALAAHRVEAHGSGGGTDQPGASAPVRCSVCRRTFPHVSALARHNRSAHTG